MANKDKKLFFMQNEYYYDNPAIKLLRAQDEGATLIVIYQLLVLNSLKTNGYLMYNSSYNYSTREISKIVGENLAITEKALFLFEKMDLIGTDDAGRRYVKKVQDLIITRSAEADRKKEYRKHRKRMLAMKQREQLLTEGHPTVELSAGMTWQELQKQMEEHSEKKDVK